MFSVSVDRATSVKLKSLERSYAGYMKEEVELPMEDPDSIYSFSFPYAENLRRNAEYQQRLNKAKRDGKVSTLVNNDNVNELLANEYFFRETEGAQTSAKIDQKGLPIHHSKITIVNTIRSHRVTIISGATGCGKSTQVPQYILDDHLKNGKGSVCRILVSQPRRISTLTVAKQVARERGEANTFNYVDQEFKEELEDEGVIPSSEKNGNLSVGFETRDAKMKPRSYASITYCTTGTILVGYLLKSPLLADVSHVIIDEVHERQVDTDLLLAIMKQILEQRVDIKLILMSASMDTNKLSRYFWHCPVIEVPGRLHQVREFYLEDILRIVSFRPKMTDGGLKMKGALKMDPDYKAQGYDDQTLDHIASVESSEGELDLHFMKSLIDFIHCNDSDLKNAILVFLTGWDAINGLDELLENRLLNAEVHRLHSDVPISEQELIMEPPSMGKRKIVLSTNIAEISLTIRDVVHVIDCGFVNTVKYLKSTNSKALSPEWEGRSNTIQRAGRAGRLKEGKCYFLFSKAKTMKMQKHMKPEIFRVPLTEIALRIKMLGLGVIESFLSGMMDCPESYVVHGAIRRLREIGALNNDKEELTPLGLYLTRLPIEPNLGKMVLFGALMGCLNVAVSAAASLSEKKPFSVTKKDIQKVNRSKSTHVANSMSDHIMLANTVMSYEKIANASKSKFCQDFSLSESNLARVSRLKRILTRELKNLGFVSSNNPSALASNGNSKNLELQKAIIAVALEPGIAVLNQHESRRFPVFKSSHPEEQKMFVGYNSVNKDKGQSMFMSKGVCFYDKMKNRKGNVQMYDTGVFDVFRFMLLSNTITSWRKVGSRWVSPNGFLQVDVSCEESVDEHLHFVAKMIGLKLQHPSMDWTRFHTYVSDLMQ